MEENMHRSVCAVLAAAMCFVLLSNKASADENVDLSNFHEMHNFDVPACKVLKHLVDDSGVLLNNVVQEEYSICAIDQGVWNNEACNCELGPNKCFMYSDTYKRRDVFTDNCPLSTEPAAPVASTVPAAPTAAPAAPTAAPAALTAAPAALTAAPAALTAAPAAPEKKAADDGIKIPKECRKCSVPEKRFKNFCRNEQLMCAAFGTKSDLNVAYEIRKQHDDLKVLLGTPKIASDGKVKYVERKSVLLHKPLMDEILEAREVGIRNSGFILNMQDFISANGIMPFGGVSLQLSGDVFTGMREKAGNPDIPARNVLAPLSGGLPVLRLTGGIDHEYGRFMIAVNGSPSFNGVGDENNSWRPSVGGLVNAELALLLRPSIFEGRWLVGPHLQGRVNMTDFLPLLGDHIWSVSGGAGVGTRVEVLRTGPITLAFDARCTFSGGVNGVAFEDAVRDSQTFVFGCAGGFGGEFGGIGPVWNQYQTIKLDKDRHEAVRGSATDQESEDSSEEGAGQ